MSFLFHAMMRSFSLGFYAGMMMPNIKTKPVPNWGELKATKYRGKS